MSDMNFKFNRSPVVAVGFSSEKTIYKYNNINLALVATC